MAAVVALAFSGLLILAFVGMFMGIAKAVTATIDRSPAEIIILDPHSESMIGNSSGIPLRIKPTIYMHPEVMGVDEMRGNGAHWQNSPKPGEKRRDTGVQIMAINPTPGSPSLPTDFSEATRQAIVEPYAVAIDRSTVKSLGADVGDRVLLNGRTVKVRALLDGYPSVTQPTVVMSIDTMNALTGGPGSRTGALVVRIKHPERAAQVRDELNAASHGAYRAWLREELSEANQNAIFTEEQIIGIILAFAVIVGIIVGVAITSQTLRGAILASIKEFASFRALGVSMGSLRRIIVELSFWVGIAGLFGTAALLAAASSAAFAIGLPLAFQPPQVIATALLLVAISIVSGLMALGVLKKSQPADLLR